MYIDVFQSTEISIKKSNEHKLLHAFIYSLKEKVWAEVQLQDPKTLEEASRLALDFGELLRPQRQLPGYPP